MEGLFARGVQKVFVVLTEGQVLMISIADGAAHAGSSARLPQMSNAFYICLLHSHISAKPNQ